jgi:two-component system, OmpR family, phosphate regulon sensor histidine kinase PhoR
LRLGIRGKLFLISSALVLLATSMVFFYARRDIEERTVADTLLSLRTRAALMAGRASQVMLSSPDYQAPDPAALRRHWQPLAIEMAKQVKCRVTIIRRDGVVLGDSDESDDALPRMENHGWRPEVRDALAKGTGSSRRYSSTISRDFMYTAATFPDQGPAYGVMRASVELSQVEAAIASLRKNLAVNAVLALGIALLVSMLTAQFASRAVRTLTTAARKMADGDLSARIPILGTDETGELGRALDQLTRSLQQSLQALKTERDRMDGVLSRMHEGVLMLDVSGHIVLVNPALREMLLLQDAIGKTPLEVIRHSELKLLLDEVVASGNAASKEIEVAGLMPRRLLVRAAPLGAEQGGVFAVFFDVTEMRRLETLRRDFIANVSHELRTPVTTIRSAGETIRDIAINDAQALPRFIDIIVRNAERLGSLLDDILELSRIESRSLRLVLEPVELESLLTQIASLFRERTDRKGLELRVTAEPSPLYAQADRRALENVLTNLIDNAVKYCGTGAVVRIGADESDGQTRIVVEDTGPGIEPTHLPRLFERFYRVDAGRSRELGGTGLGLSIVKHLVEAMGSQIRVESTPGVGSRFFFNLPRVKPDIDFRSSPSATQAAAVHAGRT